MNNDPVIIRFKFSVIGGKVHIILVEVYMMKDDNDISRIETSAIVVGKRIIGGGNFVNVHRLSSGRIFILMYNIWMNIPKLLRVDQM